MNNADAFAAEVIRNDDDRMPFAHSHIRIVPLARAYVALVADLAAAREERDAAKQAWWDQRNEWAVATGKNMDVMSVLEAQVDTLSRERDNERKAWAGIERKASNLRHELDALQDAARRAKHGDHYYDIDGPQEDCALCAAIEARYQPAWMEEPHEWMRDPVVRAALAAVAPARDRPCEVCPEANVPCEGCDAP